MLEFNLLLFTNDDVENFKKLMADSNEVKEVTPEKEWDFYPVNANSRAAKITLINPRQLRDAILKEQIDKLGHEPVNEVHMEQFDAMSLKEVLSLWKEVILSIPNSILNWNGRYYSPQEFGKYYTEIFKEKQYLPQPPAPRDFELKKARFPLLFLIGFKVSYFN